MDDRGNGLEFVSLRLNEFGRTQAVDGPNVLPVFFGGFPAQPTSGFFSETDNDLLGGQWVGEYSKPISQRLEFVAGLKLGGFYNNIDARFAAENIQFHLDAQEFSFVTDLNVGLKHHISSAASFSLGYQLLNLSNVAAGPDQSRAVNAFAPDEDDLSLNNALFNGVTAGLEVRF